MVRLIDNATHLPDREVRHLIRVARPRGVREVEVTVGTTRQRFVAHSWPNAMPPAIVEVKVGFERPFPYFHRHTRADLKRGYLSWGWLESPTELMLGLLAHELRHCWQAQHGWDQSETDADRYALAILERWRA